MRLSDILSVREECELYLTRRGLKPAARIHPSSIKILQYYFDKETGQISPEITDWFEQYLKSAKLVSRRITRDWAVQHYDTNGKFVYEQHRFFPIFDIARTQQNLDALTQAGTDEKIGIALGYPKEAARDYNKLIEGEVRNGNFMLACLAKAKLAGVPWPSWLAYISHVPEKLDLISGDVSVASREQGQVYQLFVTLNHPSLAKRIEHDFYNQAVPISFELLPSGLYTLTYRMKDLIVKYDK